MAVVFLMPDMPCLEMLHDQFAVVVDSVIVDLVHDAYQIVCTAELLHIALPNRLHELVSILAKRPFVWFAIESCQLTQLSRKFQAM